MVAHEISHSISNRRLFRASQYVQKQWLPVNQDLLAKIQAGLDEGVYELDTTFLIDDLKLDYGLFFSCLRALGLLLKKELGELPEFPDPISLLQFAGYDRLKAVLSNSDLFKSSHAFEELSDSQIARLKESVISVSAVEVLAKECRHDADEGFAIALLRQLGLTLVAWNYPSVYQKSLAASESRSVEDGVIDQLGFSPQELAVQVMSEWGLIDGMVESLLDSSQARALKDIVHLCEVGETLSRACNPKMHPPKLKSWNKAKEMILEVLGDGGLRLIQSQVLENARMYMTYHPTGFEDLKRLNPDACRNMVRSAEDKNSHSRFCSKDVKQLLDHVYVNIQEGKEKLALATLVQHVIPAAGFYGGAIFIVDPLANNLVPRVNIRQPRLVPVSKLSLDGMEFSDSPILAAYQCSSPIVENVLKPEIGYVSYVAGVLGKRQRAGVLYLEMEDISFEASQTDSLATFKAIRQAFCDCLKLN